MPVDPAGTAVATRAAEGPRLRTPRLVLRPFVAGDADDLFTMDGDARVMRWLGKGLPPRTRDEVVASIGRIAALAADRPGMSLLHASRRDGGGFVGGCGLFPLPDGKGDGEGDDVEIAYRLPVAAWGHGYATEMARAVMRHAFETLALPRVIGLTHTDNVASQRVLEKAGLRAQGEAVHYERVMRVFVAERATFAGDA